MDTTHMVRHFLAALAYRFQKAVRDAPEGFTSFNAGYGIRPPVDIIWHMNGVLGFARNILASGDEGYNHVRQQDWQKQIKLFHKTLQEIDLLLSQQSYEAKLLERLLQGPLADAMTHVVQLALIRRIAGAPVWGENFFAADIKIGNLGEHQPEPADPDEDQQYP